MNYAYCITNLINGKIYIGASTFKYRFNMHLSIAAGGKEKYPKHFQAVHAAIVKYGKENFIFEIIKIFDTKDDAFLYEEDTITYLKLLKIPNYNIAGGGLGTGSGKNHPMKGKKLPKEWVEKIAIASKKSANRPEIKEGNRKRMIERNWVGENHPMFGKTHSEEVKKKISNSSRGKLVSEETRQKMSDAAKRISKNHGAAVSKALKENKVSAGENNPKAKLTEKDVRDIRQRLSNGEDPKDIGKLYKVHRNSIAAIRDGKTWKDVK